MQDSVMELKFLFTGVDVFGKVKTAVGLLPGAKKSQSKFSVRGPAKLPVGIAAIKIQTSKSLKNRKGIPAINVTVWQDPSQCPSGIDSDQQLVKMPAGCIVSVGFISMSRNSHTNKRSKNQWSLTQIESQRKVGVLQCWVPPGVKIKGTLREPAFIF